LCVLRKRFLNRALLKKRLISPRGLITLNDSEVVDYSHSEPDGISPSSSRFTLVTLGLYSGFWRFRGNRGVEYHAILLETFGCIFFEKIISFFRFNGGYVENNLNILFYHEKLDDLSKKINKTTIFICY